MGPRYSAELRLGSMLICRGAVPGWKVNRAPSSVLLRKCQVGKFRKPLHSGSMINLTLFLGAQMQLAHCKGTLIFSLCVLQ